MAEGKERSLEGDLMVGAETDVGRAAGLLAKKIKALGGVAHVTALSASATHRALSIISTAESMLRQDKADSYIASTQEFVANGKQIRWELYWGKT